MNHAPQQAPERYGLRPPKSARGRGRGAAEVRRRTCRWVGQPLVLRLAPSRTLLHPGFTRDGLGRRTTTVRLRGRFTPTVG